MSKTYLLADSSTIIGAVIWDGLPGWTPPSGLVALDPDGLPPGTWIGATKVGSDWVMPSTVVPPPDWDAIDTAQLNQALLADGSVMRAALEVLFGVIKGTIPVTPTLTKAQFVAMLKAKMR